jgi:hypothetical protein
VRTISHARQPLRQLRPGCPARPRVASGRTWCKTSDESDAWGKACLPRRPARHLRQPAQLARLPPLLRQRDAAGKARRRVAAELIADLERIYARKKAADKELRELVEATGTSLLTLHGIGPSGAARLLIDVGNITRFPTRGHFASWNGTAPLDASSGDQVRHRLSRAGNRQINRTLHIMATVQLRNPTKGRAYYDRKKASGKTSMEAMRCLKRRLSDIVYRHMVDDAVRAMTGPGGHRERLQSPARPARIPTPALRTSHFPDPPPPSLRPRSQPRLDTEGSHERTSAARGSRRRTECRQRQVGLCIGGRRVLVIHLAALALVLAGCPIVPRTQPATRS